MSDFCPAAPDPECPRFSLAAMLAAVSLIVEYGSAHRKPVFFLLSISGTQLSPLNATKKVVQYSKAR